MEQIPSISGNNNNNTSLLTIKLYFNQIIHRIRNYKEEEGQEQELEEEKEKEKKKKKKRKIIRN
jgi:hypothetical protein